MRRQLGWLCILPALASLTQTQPAAAGVTYTSAIEAASLSRQVPLPLIQAISYVNSRWDWISTPSINGGIGPMNITPAQMASAAVLSGHSRTEISSDLSANLDAGAALLAKAHTGATDLASWKTAVAATQGPVVATQIYDLLRSGATGTASTGERITLDPQPVPGVSAPAPRTGAAAAAATDFPGATWIPASTANYSYANRPHDYPIDMIVIHDIEGTYGSAIQAFQDPNRAASAHYIVADNGTIAQMVREKDIAWHAGNWDYNTRAIGIEHEGFADSAHNWYTLTMYEQSAYLIATICSRWGVPMDRQHVIGHYQVPDPNDPSLFGGADHHTDPGPNWDWTYYMGRAVHYANLQPSPPHMVVDPVATNGLTSATVTWGAARTCHTPITGYTATSTPATQTLTFGAGARSATFTNLQPGTSYTFTVTATNPEGQDSLTSNAVTPSHCNSVKLSSAPASPQPSGTTVQLSATSAGCPNPLYTFGRLAPGSHTWTLAQATSSSSTFTWNTSGQASGTYSFVVIARDAASPGPKNSTLGPYDDSDSLDYTVDPAPCASVTATASPPTSTVAGTPVTVTGAAAGCPGAQYQFWLLPPGSSTWQMVQNYSPAPTFNWNTTGKPQGAYTFSVWARDASSTGANVTGLGTYDAFAGMPYSITPVVCTAATASTAPASPSAAGTQVVITGGSSTCPNPQYEFWAKWQGSSSWQLVRGYASSPTFTWNSTGALAGTEQFGVWARDAGSNAAYDTFAGIPFTVTTPSCASVTASASPASPAAHGMGVQVTITGAAAGCTNGNPQYEFWMQPAGSTKWLLLRGYSSNPSYVWNTNGAPAETERFGVWARDAASTAGYDTYIGINYTLT